MVENNNIRTSVLTGGVVISAGILLMAAVGMFGLVGVGPEIRPMLPMGFALGLFNLIACIGLLRK